MSISISKHVYKRLSEDEDLIQAVGERIYPLSTLSETSFPFIVYRRNSLVPESTKDRYSTGDAVTVEIAVVSDNYLSSVNIAQSVRRALEYKWAKYEDFSVTDARLMSADEDFIEDTFIQRLVFSFKTE